MSCFCKTIEKGGYLQKNTHDFRVKSVDGNRTDTMEAILRKEAAKKNGGAFEGITIDP